MKKVKKHIFQKANKSLKKKVIIPYFKNKKNCYNI